MSVEALLGTPEAFRPEIQAARPPRRAGGVRRPSARAHCGIRDSGIAPGRRPASPGRLLLSAASRRCTGRARAALGHARGILEVEVNSATDNPLVFPVAEGRSGESGSPASSGGNFHAQIVAQALDLLAIAVAGRGVHVRAPRRAAHQPRPVRSGCPRFLPVARGSRAGLMVAQVVVADLLSEMARPGPPGERPTRCRPAPARKTTSAMGLAAARKARRAVSCLERNPGRRTPVRGAGHRLPPSACVRVTRSKRFTHSSAPGLRRSRATGR